MFGLCLRYLTSLPDSSCQKLEAAIIDALGHISEIRSFYGGTPGDQ
jgi:hypothetical protein